MGVFLQHSLLRDHGLDISPHQQFGLILSLLNNFLRQKILLMWLSTKRKYGYYVNFFFANMVPTHLNHNFNPHN